MAFLFKQFNIDDDLSAMKVGTDAIILGAWASVDDIKTILDVGTGSGIIALMVAQRSQAIIDALDIDKESIKQAKENFRSSPWPDRLNAIYASLFDYSNNRIDKYDAILSNPPYFLNALKPNSGKRTLARHSDQDSSELFIKSVAQLLSPDGKFSVINPIPEGDLLHEYALKKGLYCNRRTMVIPREDIKANRVLLEFGFEEKTKLEDTLIIYDSNNKYTSSFKKLTRDFYLNF